MVGADEGVAFPMTNLLAPFNVRSALAQRSAVGDLPPAISPAGVAFSLLLLTTQVLPKIAAQGLVGVNMLVKRFMAHWQLTGDLLGAPLQAQQGVGLPLHPGRYCVGIAAVLRAFSGYFTGLLGTVPARADIATQFTTDGGFMSPRCTEPPWMRLKILSVTSKSTFVKGKLSYDAMRNSASTFLSQVRAVVKTRPSMDVPFHAVLVQRVSGLLTTTQITFPPAFYGWLGLLANLYFVLVMMATPGITGLFVQLLVIFVFQGLLMIIQDMDYPLDLDGTMFNSKILD